MSDTPITRRSALKLGALCATGTAVLSKHSISVRASGHEPPSADEVSTSIPRTTYIEPNSDAGFHYPYFLHLPDTTAAKNGYPRPIFVLPSVSPSDDDSFQYHLDKAKINLSIAPALSKNLGTPVLHPVIPRPMDTPRKWWYNPQKIGRPHLELDEDDGPLARSDKQLLAMIDDARARLESNGYTIADKIHLDGFSTSGTFTKRFTAMHPERVNAMSSGGNGASILPFEQLPDGISTANEPQWDELSYPDRSLPYPVGVYDFETLIGKQFNQEAWKRVDKFVYLGSEDRPDPSTNSSRYPYLLSYSSDVFPDWTDEVESDYYGISELTRDIYGKYRVKSAWPVSKAAYQKADPDNTTLTLYEGIGHNPNPVTDDIIAFHKTPIINEYGPGLTRDDIIVQGGTLTDDGTRELTTGQQMIYTAVFTNHKTSPGNVTVTLMIDGTEAESVTKEVSPGQTRRIPLAYTFTRPGTYTVKINGDNAGAQPTRVLPAKTPTPTPSPTPSSTPTPTPDTPIDTETSTPTSDETTGDSGPGFGIGAAISGVAAAGYMLARSHNNTE